MKKGPEGFERFYRDIWGDRWDSLRAALTQPRQGCRFEAGLLCPYTLDPASVFCAQCLPLPRDGWVGDLCAAPGGKTLVLAGRLPRGARLIANEKSTARRRRLLQVLDTHLPAAIREHINVWGLDATQFGRRFPEHFDSILLDVPCSSERHLLEKPSELNLWGPGRPKHLSIQALALAASALDSLRPGGYLLYCTCSVNPNENDGVWDRMTRKRTGWSRTPLPPGPGEETRWGRIILPDRCAGMGPLYFSLIRKTPETPESEPTNEASRSLSPESDGPAPG